MSNLEQMKLREQLKVRLGIEAHTWYDEDDMCIALIHILELEQKIKYYKNQLHKKDLVIYRICEIYKEQE